MKNIFNNLKKLRIFKSINTLFAFILQKKLTKFQIIFLSYFLIFSIFLFLSLPSLYNYETFKKQIVKNVYSEFKITLDNVKEINYRFVPSPHLVVKSADLKIGKTEKPISKVDNIKIFFSIIDFYSSRKFNLKELKIKKANFYFEKETLNYFKNHFYNNIIKKITISNSNFFFKDKNNNIVTISPIYKMKYYIDFNAKEKKLELKGNLFDLNYNFDWNKNYNRPEENNLNLKFKNPNIQIINKLENLSTFENRGDLKIKFFGNNIVFKYFKNKNLIDFKTISSKNNSYNFDGQIRTTPFFFNVNTILKNLDINFFIDNFLNNIQKYENNIHTNFNGKIFIKLENFKNSVLKNGNIILNFKENNIDIDEANFDINKIGSLDFSNGRFKAVDNKIYYSMETIFNIKNQKQFYKYFLIPRENRINISKIKFTLEKNLDTTKFFISNITLNKLENNNTSNSQYEFDNIQQLRFIMRNYFETVNAG